MEEDVGADSADLSLSQPELFTPLWGDSGSHYNDKLLIQPIETTTQYGSTGVEFTAFDSGRRSPYERYSLDLLCANQAIRHVSHLINVYMSPVTRDYPLSSKSCHMYSLNTVSYHTSRITLSLPRLCAIYTSRAWYGDGGLMRQTILQNAEGCAPVCMTQGAQSSVNELWHPSTIHVDLHDEKAACMRSVYELRRCGTSHRSINLRRYSEFLLGDSRDELCLLSEEKHVSAALA
ncbi:hypothetical protein SODALDRAFT_358209 [Sodiomyces alkalinus F11]|uniref:Uncharacterized protein n=1 Tax=Sodiomyces alkalinus (strain CBS 110278 / VKM F-3762 / F11) TaxID=1314773 RepID=A0A3N2PZ81_SODAK|nr:hypothetical protein SODALDRAFT_358209 [Sodiomyces alkalinus F11]ROT39792.1 hypothetical protein SODALDRAFT_358209 [Sodiomyces alkalinus F11]